MKKILIGIAILSFFSCLILSLLFFPPQAGFRKWKQEIDSIPFENQFEVVDKTYAKTSGNPIGGNNDFISFSCGLIVRSEYQPSEIVKQVEAMLVDVNTPPFYYPENGFFSYNGRSTLYRYTECQVYPLQTLQSFELTNADFREMCQTAMNKYKTDDYYLILLCQFGNSEFIH